MTILTCNSIQVSKTGDARLILNAKVNFAVNKHLDIYLNGRNLLDQGNTEFYGADRTGMLLLAGLKVNF